LPQEPLRPPDPRAWQVEQRASCPLEARRNGKTDTSDSTPNGLRARDRPALRRRCCRLNVGPRPEATARLVVRKLRRFLEAGFASRSPASYSSGPPSALDIRTGVQVTHQRPPVQHLTRSQDRPSCSIACAGRIETIDQTSIGDLRGRATYPTGDRAASARHP
jgi:hypothetical protein